MSIVRFSLRTDAPRRRGVRTVLVTASVLAAGFLAAIAGAASAGFTLGPAEPALGGLPAYLVPDGGGPLCYPVILPEELVDPTAPVSYPDNIPHEFAYFDHRALPASVAGGGTLRWRATVQGFGLDAGETPIIRNFFRLTMLGVPAGTYAVIAEPQNAFSGTVFEVDASGRALAEWMVLSPDDVTGPVHDLTQRTGRFVLARDGVVVADLEMADFIGCGTAAVPTSPRPTTPTARFQFVCGFLRCAFDARTSVPGVDPITSFQWDFGDGGTGTGDKIVHEFATAGTYRVRLTVGDGTNTHALEVDVSPSTTPPPGAVTHTFEGVRTNKFLGVVVAPGATVQSVSASVSGSAFRPMTKVGPEEWRATELPARNALVQFKALTTDGREELSRTFEWPSFR